MEEAPTLESKEQSPASLLKLHQEKSNESWYIKMGSEICDMVEHFQDWNTDDNDYKETQFIRQLLWKTEDYSFYIRREIRQKNYLPINVVCACILPFILNVGMEDIYLNDDRITVLAKAISDISIISPLKPDSLGNNNLLYLKQIFYTLKNKNIVER